MTIEPLPLARELLTVEEYLALSAKINYQLSARALNPQALLALVLGSADVSERGRHILVAAFDVLRAGYRKERRRLGTPGILHPLRAAAILARTLPRPPILHLLTALLHDKEEDLTEEGLGAEHFAALSVEYARLLALLTEEERAGLTLRIRLLANHTGSYQDYLARVLAEAGAMPDLIWIKLADRIDNTFDITLQHPGVTRYNFYRAVFDILFLPSFRGVDMGPFHFLPELDEGVMLLGQLFKDTLFLALLRGAGIDARDPLAQRLFNGLAVAGIREAQWLALELFHTSLADVGRQRALLLAVMQYTHGGGAGAVTVKADGGAVDGMLLEFFTLARRGEQKGMLRALFTDREHLAQMVLVFIVIFASFVNDPDFNIAGVSLDGVIAAASDS